MTDHEKKTPCDECPGLYSASACANLTELGRCGQKLRREFNPDLEAEIARYEDEIHGYESTSYDGCVEIARHFAAWQKEQDERKCHGCFDRDEVFRQGLLKGAKEIAEEGRSQIVKRGLATMKVVIEISEETLDNLGVEIGEEVVVQIRKKA